MNSATLFFYFSIPEHEPQIASAPPFPLFRHTQREPSYHEKQIYSSIHIFNHLSHVQMVFAASSLV